MEDACFSPVTLGLFHDFLRKLDEWLNTIGSCLKNSSCRTKRKWNHQDGLPGKDEPYTGVKMVPMPIFLIFDLLMMTRRPQSGPGMIHLLFLLWC